MISEIRADSHLVLRRGTVNLRQVVASTLLFGLRLVQCSVDGGLAPCIQRHEHELSLCVRFQALIEIDDEACSDGWSDQASQHNQPNVEAVSLPLELVGLVVEHGHFFTNLTLVRLHELNNQEGQVVANPNRDEVRNEERLCPYHLFFCGWVARGLSEMHSAHQREDGFEKPRQHVDRQQLRVASENQPANEGDYASDCGNPHENTEDKVADMQR